MTIGEVEELCKLVKRMQPAYAGHQNRSRAGVQNRLVLDRRYAKFMPTAVMAETVEVTPDGEAAFANLPAGHMWKPWSPSSRGRSACVICKAERLKASLRFSYRTDVSSWSETVPECKRT